MYPFSLEAIQSPEASGRTWSWASNVKIYLSKSSLPNVLRHQQPKRAYTSVSTIPTSGPQIVDLRDKLIRSWPWRSTVSIKVQQYSVVPPACQKQELGPSTTRHYAPRQTHTHTYVIFPHQQLPRSTDHFNHFQLYLVKTMSTSQTSLKREATPSPRDAKRARSSANDATSTAPPVQNPIRWDAQFNDPKADVVLISTENIRLRLSSWHLAKKR
jgi:hypothetical protein